MNRARNGILATMGAILAAAGLAQQPGFHMDLPPGWHAASTKDGAIVARSGDGGSMVAIAPVLDAGNTAAADWLRSRGAAGLTPYLRGATISAVYPSRSNRSAALASVSFSGGAARVLFFVAGGTGTLYVMAAPAQAMPQQSGALMRILRSFSFAGERASSGQPNVTYTNFTDPREAAFTLDVPAGWKATGGTIRHSTLDFRMFLYATSPDGATVIRLGDPDFGTFTEPNPMLEMAGMHEGMNYSPGYGNVWPIRRYAPGPQFAQSYSAKLARETQTSGVQFKTVQPLPEFSSNSVVLGTSFQTTAGEASFTCARSGREAAGTVLAATQKMGTPGFQGSIWFVSTLGDFISPAPEAAAANQIMLHMVTSFRLNPEWQARQSQTAVDTSRIVTETNQHISKVINDSYWNRQRTLERTNRNFDDYIRGVVRLRDPNTGEELEGRAGKNYYYQIPGNRTLGSDREIVNPDFTELEQIR